MTQSALLIHSLNLLMHLVTLRSGQAVHRSWGGSRDTCSQSKIALCWFMVPLYVYVCMCMCNTHCVCVCVPVYVEGLFGLGLGQGWSRVHKAKTER